MNRQLLIDTRKYAEEVRWKSWWHLAVTLALGTALVVTIALSESFAIRFACSLLMSLTIVRMFIIYHDYMHGAILKGSKLADYVLKFCGFLMLTPPSVWKRSHDHHHHHNSKLFGANIGSFPIMTTTGYQSSTPVQRLMYRWVRSPLFIALGYFTVFLFGMCICPLIQNVRKHTDVFFTLLVHFGAIALAVLLLGGSFAIYAFVLPSLVAMMLGSYLFYIQHNFPTAQMHADADWTYADAALDSSSFLESGPIMQWFLGNIGYHHVHHLNSKIPFYKLPEAMRGLPALQNPGRTSFALRDIQACFRLKLWDHGANEFVSFPAAAKLAHCTPIVPVKIGVETL